MFRETQRQVREYYQLAVLTDYLPTVAGKSVVNSVLPSVRFAYVSGVNLRYYQPCSEGMPVEFAAAAYRFGHSQVRAFYRVNQTQPQRVPVLTTDWTNASSNITGLGPAPSNYGIDWSYFFLTRNVREANRPQNSYKLDNSLTYALSLLPGPVSSSGPTSLAKRNLLRGRQLGLPSGQDVARSMGVTPLRDDQVLIGKATGDPAETKGITDVDASFAGNAPLWTYILAEATAQAYPVSGGKITGAQYAPMRLGPVGGRIVTETMVGMVWADSTSVLHDAFFIPDPAIADWGTVGFKQILQFATS